jgi:hypothetical protein
MRIKLGDDCYVDPAYVVGYYETMIITEPENQNHYAITKRVVRIELAGGRYVETGLSLDAVAVALDDAMPPVEPMISVDGGAILNELRGVIARFVS